MEIAILTDTGCEEAAIAEAERLLRRPRLSNGALFLEASLQEACTLSYLSCTARRVIATVARPATLGDLDAISPQVPRDLLPEGCTFKVEGEVIGAAMPTQQLVEAVGGWFQRATGRKVSLQRPDVVVFASAMREGILIGMDISGPLAKREWRVMLSNRSLKSTVAASAAIYAGLDAGETIFDPFGDDGTLAIEAALVLSQTSPRRHAKALAFQRFVDDAWRREQDARAKHIAPLRVFCESLREMKAVRVNSKLAGAHELIQSTRVPIDWADLKVEEGSVDRIITHAPQSGKVQPERKTLQRIDDLFNQAAYLLKEKGTITCVTGKPEELRPAAKKYGFKEREERALLMGKLPMSVLTFWR